MEKIFRNCSVSDSRFVRVFKRNCLNCPRHRHCIQKRQQLKRKKWAKRYFLEALIFCFIITAAFYMVDYYFSPISEGDSHIFVETPIMVVEAEDETETEIETETESETETETETEQLPRISAYEPGESYYYDLCWQDKLYIARLVYQEARGEIFEGKVAVAAVVLNRFFEEDNGRFDQTSIWSIINEPGEFASISDVSDEMVAQVPECMESVEAACKGWDPTRLLFEGGAKFFYAPANVYGDRALEREGIEVLTIGNHNFHNDFNRIY